MPFSLVIEGGPHEGLPRLELRRRIRAIVGALAIEESELSVLLTGDARIKELNGTYRAKDKPTDVLAFAMREGEFASLAGAVLGDVVVSVETARRQAARAKKTVLDEVTMLLAHGILHLLGWDHDTLPKERRMKAETDRLCAAARGEAAPGEVARSKVSRGTGGEPRSRGTTAPGRPATPGARRLAVARPSKAKTGAAKSSGGPAAKGNRSGATATRSRSNVKRRG